MLAHERFLFLLWHWSQLQQPEQTVVLHWLCRKEQLLEGCWSNGTRIACVLLRVCIGRLHLNSGKETERLRLRNSSYRWSLRVRHLGAGMTPVMVTNALWSSEAPILRRLVSRPNLHCNLARTADVAQLHSADVIRAFTPAQLQLDKLDLSLVLLRTVTTSLCSELLLVKELCFCPPSRTL